MAGNPRLSGIPETPGHPTREPGVAASGGADRNPPAGGHRAKPDEPSRLTLKKDTTPVYFISLGGGVQSSTMALMAARGLFPVTPAAAVFADTQSEPAGVYAWLLWLERQLPFPVLRVTRGNLGDDACRTRVSRNGKTYTKHAVPAFIKDTDGRIGLAMRQCTTDHKIEVLHREYNRLRDKRPVVQWIGISRDEAHRMKPARRPWLTNAYPLVDAGMTRKDCLQWMADNGYPRPPRSACTFCPYHSDAEWRRLKLNDPASFADAVCFERRYQAALSRVSGFRGTPYLHRSCVPLDQADFRPTDERTGQANLFGNECEGMCGV